VLIPKLMLYIEMQICVTDFIGIKKETTVICLQRRNGDIMLYGSRTLVLFYETFSSSYSYTSIGIVNDVSRYASALGSGNVTVSFELED